MGVSKFKKNVILIQVIFLVLNGALLFSQDRKAIIFTDIDGLPRNIVYCVDKDIYGYLWIGTTNGIARYDGVEFKSYDEFDGVTIFSVLVDTKNQVWIATSTDLLLYNRLSDSFQSMSEGYIQKILEDSLGQIYFSTPNSISKYNKQGNTTIVKQSRINDFCFSPEGIWYSSSYNGATLLSRESHFKKVKEKQIEDQSVSTIIAIEKSTYFGTKSGQLFIRDKAGIMFQAKLDNHYILKSIYKIDDEIWLATDGNGILVLDHEKRFSRIINQSSNTTPTISSNSIYAICQGENSEIWIASYGGGLTCLLPANPLFKNLSHDKGNANSLVAREGVFAYSKNDQLFLGTNYGMSIYNEKENTFKNLSISALKNDLNGCKVLGVCCDNNNNFWVGTYDGLLGKYNENFSLIKAINPSSSDVDEMQQIILMHNHKDRNILLATQYSNRSLLNFSINDGTIKPLSIEHKGVRTAQFEINAIRETNNGEVIALVSDKGLFKINVEQNTVEQIGAKATEKIEYWISDFYIDKRGGLWFATNNGLYYNSVDGDNFKHWTTEEGLPTNSLVRMESVNDNFIWISTISGICRFDLNSYDITTFNYNDGLAANEFSLRASTITSNNNIVFGSVAGFTMIKPDKLSSSVKPSEVIISDITFQNKSIKDNTNASFLTKPIEETKSIQLPYHNNSFTLRFFTRNEVVPKNNTYKYRMLGLENNWIALGKTNQTTYTNLMPGQYTFEVINTNKMNSGQQKSTQLAIEILSPWYFNWYAFAFYLMCILGIIYLFIYAYTNRLNYKKELEISDYKIQSEQELTEKKLAFFTNISHDLKTPLTLIDAPVYDLLRSPNLSEDDQQKLEVIRRNSKRLYKLITDLIDFRRLTKRQIPLHIQKTDLALLLNNIYNAFQIECQNKSIDFSMSNTIEEALFLDADKVEKILWNLLSNAIKYTEEDGQIFISVEKIRLNNKNYLIITVSDTGIGIPKELIAKVFDRFYQIPVHSNNTNEGTGIGLSIVKDLVETHYAKINVESTVNVGTTFTISIPVGKEQYSDREIQKMPTSRNLFSESVKDENIPINGRSGIKKQYSKPVLLIVEDNMELRDYLCKHFENNYKVLEASEGAEGLNVALDKNPDIILTDVSMPGMNGHEFCKKVRLKFELSHIPIVMLTANAALEQKIEGLAIGADAYLTKPFDIELLDTTLQTLLENRKKIRNRLLGAEKEKSVLGIIPKQEMAFIEDISLFIHDHMKNMDLNVEMIANNFALSRVHLNRKVKALTGNTTIRLINSIRLKKAYNLIKEQQLRVSEAAYETGFNDPNYFTICFKKEFGENPSKLS